MPRKVRDLVKDYLDAGFVIVRGGKGSHRKLRHPSGITTILSGKDGDDAKNYQEKELIKKTELAVKRGKK